MKTTKIRADVRPHGARPKQPSPLPSGQRVFRTQVEVGDVISFDPTGEQLRVSKIADGQITFEKLT